MIILVQNLLSMEVKKYNKTEREREKFMHY
jgi:hypothetical protein